MTNDNDHNATQPNQDWDAEQAKGEAAYAQLMQALPIVQPYLWYDGEGRGLAAARCLSMVGSFLDPDIDDHQAWQYFLSDLSYFPSFADLPETKELDSIFAAIEKATTGEEDANSNSVEMVAPQPVRVAVTTTEFEVPLGNLQDSQRAAEIIRAARTNRQ